MLYIYINIYIYIYIVIKEKTNNIFEVEVFQLLPLSIHNLSLNINICFSCNLVEIYKLFLCFINLLYQIFIYVLIWKQPPQVFWQGVFLGILWGLQEGACAGDNLRPATLLIGRLGAGVLLLVL